MFEFIANNIQYPIVAEENGVQGRVLVSFVIKKDGSLSNVRVVKSVDPALDKEAVRLIKSMPKWSPGKEKGQFVNVKFTVPVTFRLQQICKKKEFSMTKIYVKTDEYEAFNIK